ncbi:MAG: sugar ABC transporter permease, partial [Verrucomicrobia bacterium]|nr:sugar ABC transporter permease [Deltaproteobacteria bacterium]
MKAVTVVPLTTSIKQKFKFRLWGTLFVLPEIIIFLMFLWVPIVKGIVYSFYNVDFVKGNTFIGLQNYIEVIHSADFPIAIRN